jgi:NAD(P)-dependent dehydrogenase (short-subunit alcohol dehydrogenase family)
MINKNAVWLITGCSKGLGRAIAQQALTSGYRVVVTARNTADISDIVEEHDDKALAVQLDVSKPDQIKAAVLAAEERFGSVDVVNNPGYGYLAAVEEGEGADIRRSLQHQFDRWPGDLSGRGLLPCGEVWS